jgi:inner membrane protease subunit 2
MAPTFNPSSHETGRRDWVVFRRYLERKVPKGEEGSGGLRRGDVVSFWKPHHAEEIGLKRVVAVEGDTVYPNRGYAVDPTIRSEARLQGMPDGLDSHVEPGKIVVPYGHVWVEGDNWRMSWDSNDFGPISKALIQDKAVWIWREWGEVIGVGDQRRKRDRKMGSRVVKGRSEIPEIFLE